RKKIIFTALIFVVLGAIFSLYLTTVTVMPQNMRISCIYGTEGFDAGSNFHVSIPDNTVTYAPYPSNITKKYSLTKTEAALYINILKMSEKTEFKSDRDITERDRYALPVHINITEFTYGNKAPVYSKYDYYSDRQNTREYYSALSASKYAKPLTDIIYFGFYLREFYWWLLPLMFLLAGVIINAAFKSKYTKKAIVYARITLVLCILFEVINRVWTVRINYLSSHYMWGNAGALEKTLRKITAVQSNARINFIPLLILFAVQLVVLIRQKQSAVIIASFGAVSAPVTAALYFMFQKKLIFTALLRYVRGNMFLGQPGNPHVYVFWGCIVFLISFLLYVSAGLITKQKKADVIIRSAACALGLSLLVIFPCFGINIVSRY
ncbi:MAG: hypothetical protein IJR59_03995, partial [Firmicutes bacterium]|nr:hypothetical protein [Bacillota bacterium]